MTLLSGQSICPFPMAITTAANTLTWEFGAPPPLAVPAHAGGSWRAPEPLPAGETRLDPRRGLPWELRLSDGRGTSEELVHAATKGGRAPTPRPRCQPPRRGSRRVQACLAAAKLPPGQGPGSGRPGKQGTETQEGASHLVQYKVPRTGEGAWGSGPVSTVTSGL